MYEDDATIGDNEPLWRRLSPIGNQIVFDQNAGNWRPSSAAFNDSSDGTPMSVTLAGDASRAGVSAEDYLTSFPGFSLVMLNAGYVRSLKQTVSRFTTIDDAHHAYVAGKKTDSVKRSMAKNSAWVVFNQPPKSSY